MIEGLKNMEQVEGKKRAPLILFDIRDYLIVIISYAYEFRIKPFFINAYRFLFN